MNIQQKSGYAREEHSIHQMGHCSSTVNECSPCSHVRMMHRSSLPLPSPLPSHPVATPPRNVAASDDSHHSQPQDRSPQPQQSTQWSMRARGPATFRGDRCLYHAFASIGVRSAPTKLGRLLSVCHARSLGPSTERRFTGPYKHGDPLVDLAVGYNSILVAPRVIVKAHSFITPSKSLV